MCHAACVDTQLHPVTPFLLFSFGQHTIELFSIHPDIIFRNVVFSFTVSRTCCSGACSYMHSCTCTCTLACKQALGCAEVSFVPDSLVIIVEGQCPGGLEFGLMWRSRDRRNRSLLLSNVRTAMHMFLQSDLCYERSQITFSFPVLL
jgi:hypothetical protein